MKKICFIFTVLVFSLFSISTAAQTRRKPRTKIAVKTAPKQSASTPAKIIITTPPTELPHKKNERAEADLTPAKKNERVEIVKNAPAVMPFVYEFSQPQFQIKSVRIEHNAAGKGTITFEKQDVSEALTDPLQISPQAWNRIKSLWNELNFLDSTEDYQSVKYNYPHLGVMKLRRSEGDKQREAKFDWTDNKTIKSLTEEYKKLTEQYVWMFDMNLALENQPLNAPQLTNRLVALYNRKMLSDPKQMLPFLRELANDERIALVARNQTAKLIERIEKQKDDK